MGSKLEFRRRNPLDLMSMVVMAAVGVVQGLLAAQSLVYGRLTFALLHLLVSVSALGYTAWLLTAPLLRLQGDNVTVYMNPFRPQSLDRSQISGVDLDGKRTFLVLVDGSRVEVPVALASARDGEQMLESLQGLANQ